MKELITTLLLFSSIVCWSQSTDISITALRPTNRCPNGELNLSINDGLGPYDITWWWESGSTSFVLEQHSAVNGNSGIEDLESLPVGTYSVNITNDLCGTYEETIELRSGLIFGDSDRIEADVDHVQTCGVEGTNDGRITITRIIGIDPPYSIRWSGPGIAPGTAGNSIEDLRDGSYTVTIKTADGCELTRTFQICCCEQNINNPDRPKDANKTDRCVSTQQNFPVSILRDILFSPDDATSFNGELRINIDGGNQNNELTWTGPNGFFSNREYIFGLGVGEYCATVDNGCSEATRCFELVDCSGDCVFTCNGTPTVGQDLVSPQCIGNDVCQPNIADGQVDVSKYGLSEISTVADMILLATGGNGPLHAKKFLFPTGATLDSRLEDLDFNGEISTLIQVKDWDELAAHLSNENSNGAYQQSSVLADGENFKVYPVPTTGWLNIELSDNKGIQASVLRVIDVTGTTQFKMTLEANVSLLNIDLSGLPNGVYFIQLSTNGGASFTKRITLIK